MKDVLVWDPQYTPFFTHSFLQPLGLLYMEWDVSNKTIGCLLQDQIHGLVQDCGISSTLISNGDTAILHQAIDMSVQSHHTGISCISTILVDADHYQYNGIRSISIASFFGWCLNG